MRETFHLKGKKQKVQTISEADILVGESTREGSLGHYTWFHGTDIIAEAWLHKYDGWWLRIKA